MTRTTLTLLVLFGLSSAAVAGPMPMDKRVAPRPRDEHYWLSSDLSKLVFWRVPERDTAAGAPRR